MNKKLHRSQDDKMLAGICGAIGNYFNIDSNLIRILWVFLSLVYGSGLLLYLVCWIIIPE